jgi:hypothetical protein
MPAMTPSLILRLAKPADAALVRRLAQLEGAKPPREALIAELEGDVLAAISLYDGRVVADPFQRTEHAVGLLRLRRRQILEARRLSHAGQALRPHAAGRAIRLPAA